MNSGQSVLQGSPEANASYPSHLHIILKDLDVVLIQSQSHQLSLSFYSCLRMAENIFSSSPPKYHLHLLYPKAYSNHYLKSSWFSFTLLRPIADIRQVCVCSCSCPLSCTLMASSVFSHRSFLVSTLMLLTNSFRRGPLGLCTLPPHLCLIHVPHIFKT